MARNAQDRSAKRKNAVSPVDNNITAFALGMEEGALRGAFVSSLLIWLPLFAFTNIITAGTSTVALAAIAGTSALLVGAYHGIKEVKKHQQRMHEKQAADRVAEKSQAAPAKGHEKQEPQHDTEQEQQTDAPPKDGFLAREKASRDQPKTLSADCP